MMIPLSFVNMMFAAKVKWAQFKPAVKMNQSHFKWMSVSLSVSVSVSVYACFIRIYSHKHELRSPGNDDSTWPTMVIMTIPNSIYAIWNSSYFAQSEPTRDSRTSDKLMRYMNSMTHFIASEKKNKQDAQTKINYQFWPYSN